MDNFHTMIKREQQKKLKADSPHTNATQDIPNDFIQFNKIIGLPLHPTTNTPTPLTKWEKGLAEEIITDKNHKHWIINKSRKIGITEFILRFIAFQCFHEYAGYDVMIVAQREEQAKEIMRRLQGLFINIPDKVKDQSVRQITLHNNTRVFAFPSNSESFRGPDRVKCIFLDEAAHFNVIDDEKVYTALTPNLSGTNGHLFIVSTPNGPRGFFWRIYHDTELNFVKKTYDYNYGYEANIISEQFIELQRKSNMYFEQEYNCQFLAASSSVFIPQDLEGIFV